MEFGGDETLDSPQPSADPTPVGEVLLVTDPTTEIDVDASSDAERPRMDLRGVAVRLVALLVVVAAMIGGWFALVRADAPAAPRPTIPLDAWAPYWTLEASAAAAPLRLDSMREISPFWFNATGVDDITVDPNANGELIEEFMDIARDSDALLVPSIVDALPAGEMAEILADPATRTRHVDAILTFAEAGEFDGIDIDYEQFAFADGRDTWEATRPNWVAFVEELGARLSAAGRTLAVSIPPVYDAERTSNSGFWVYDYGAIAPHVDRIRIMAYDFSFNDPGPIAPLSFVQRAIDGTIAAVGSPDKLVLGLPAYGRNWPIGVTGTCPADVELEGITSVNNRTVEDLIERRNGSPVFDETTGEWSFTYDIEFGDAETQCAQTRQVHYVDADGIALRMDLARAAQLDGVSLWAFGFDDDAVWDAILPTAEEPAQQ